MECEYMVYCIHTIYMLKSKMQNITSHIENTPCLFQLKQSRWKYHNLRFTICEDNQSTIRTLKQNYEIWF